MGYPPGGLSGGMPLAFRSAIGALQNVSDYGFPEFMKFS
jgi:hypothetical protein